MRLKGWKLSSVAMQLAAFAPIAAAVIGFSSIAHGQQLAVNWDLEIVVDGNVTFYRCTSNAGFQTQIEDCSDNESVWDCRGEVIALERDQLGNCSVRFATTEESLAFLERQGARVDTLLAAGEIPGGGQQGTPPGAIDPNFGRSNETPAALVRDSTPGVTPPGPPVTSAQ